VTVSRRLSQAISEGDGISVIAHVSSVDEARAAEEEGAEALAISHPIPGLREETALPILWHGTPDWAAAAQAGADACVVGEHDGPVERLESVVYVSDEERLAAALEGADPEVFLLGLPEGEAADVEEVFEAVLDLLPDVPAGKLAIAEVAVRTRDEVEALERAGMDAVLVEGGNVAALVGGAPPEV
jgi:NAD(P)H-dependent flavin oxidoreductase YrpB (nitropropane dioxygenase family)